LPQTRCNVPSLESQQFGLPGEQHMSSRPLGSVPGGQQTGMPRGVAIRSSGQQVFFPADATQRWGLQHLLSQFTRPLGQHFPFEQTSPFWQQSSPQRFSVFVHLHLPCSHSTSGPQQLMVFVAWLKQQVRFGSQHFAGPVWPA
jgi:hypothetical protein